MDARVAQFFQTNALPNESSYLIINKEFIYKFNRDTGQSPLKNGKEIISLLSSQGFIINRKGNRPKIKGYEANPQSGLTSSNTSAYKTKPKTESLPQKAKPIPVAKMQEIKSQPVTKPKAGKVLRIISQAKTSFQYPDPKTTVKTVRSRVVTQKE